MPSTIVNADPQFIFTILFLSLGPVKIIFPFVKLTHNATPEYRRNVAICATLLATIVVLVVALFGHNLIAKYQLSLDALRLAGGLILLISALFNTFPHLQPPLDIPKTELTAIQLAIRSIVSPIIIPPIGIAAILIFTTLFQGSWEMQWIIVKSLLTIMVFDLIAMLFADQIIKIPGLIQFLSLATLVLNFIQVSLAIEVILISLKSLAMIIK